MPAPVVGVAPDLRAYLAGLEERLSALETPAGFLPAFLTTSAQITPANAKQAAGRWAILSDLKTLAWSDGAHWRRADTGAVVA